MNISNLNTIRNYVQLTPLIGTSGQPMENQFILIADHGYRVVINLGMTGDSIAVAREAEIVTSLGMDYFHIPVPFDAPEPHHLESFIKLMDEHSNERVFVHCIANYRVSAFMYHYLKSIRGYSEDESRSPMFDTWKPDRVWQNVLEWDVSKITS